MSNEPKRWSGYHTQSEPWQRGYEWAYDRGEHGHLDHIEAAEAYGYDFLSAEAEQFEKGANFAQAERYE